jgi:uncharacterized protein YbaR (Trm112 family)
MALLKEFVDILACPQCKRKIELLPDRSGLICSLCRLKYPILDDIPVMLVDEAEKLCE